ncbi:ABC transporter substrate-binding protein [Microbacterium maritypicum]|uniref:ABC transporter substrate-binding protein n=1 Tax=Microbacterium maritypicum TaxID=33918 RepID=UPI00382E1EDD
MKNRSTFMKLALLTATGSLLVPLAACSADSGGDAGGTVPIQWWTWDQAQSLSYEKCADLFNEQNPDIDVKVSYYNWNDYWTKLTAGFVAGDAPDTFMNHANYFPEYVSQGQLLALDDLIDSSNFDLDRFSVGVETWTYTDGKHYGLPKDWATEVWYYNEDAVAAAGLTADDMQNMTWAPDGSGTFGEIVKKLTVDANGVHGDQPGFDKDNVAVYGLMPMGLQGNNGQDSWSGFLSTTGWTLGDEKNWPTRFQYDEQVFKDSLTWIRSLSSDGFSPKNGAFTTEIADWLGSGKIAMAGSHTANLSALTSIDGVNISFAPTVIGENGERKSLTNSNGDSIWAGTKHPDEAWKWVSFLGSTDCQSLAGADGTFFPSIPESMQVTQEAMAEKGIDVAPLVELVNNGQTFTTPVFQRGGELDATLKPMWEKFFNFSGDDEVFDQMTAESERILAQQ